MRSLVVYESMFGNTELVARAIAEGLSPFAEVEISNVDNAPGDLNGGVDLLVIGGPTHAHGMSRKATRADAARQVNGAVRSRRRGIREWLEEFSCTPAGIAVFDTRVKAASWLVGSAARGAAKLLRHNGIHLVTEPESFFVDGGSAPGELLTGELNRARGWGEKLGELMRAARSANAG
ncbi:flavodoxin family protein [Amycolatopsis anabasis]|uniref:flavodoxin family protein n=1 Tax=Amycolatopsis anabasis TaxID=1840409 RepID=UPI00131E008C|nr:flavodoxin domain-containing protein [Amycolatopsis anabasis]